MLSRHIYAQQSVAEKTAAHIGFVFFSTAAVLGDTSKIFTQMFVQPALLFALKGIPYVKYEKKY